MRRKTSEPQFWENSVQEKLQERRKRTDGRTYTDIPKEKKEKEVYNYVQDYINVKDIRNGIIITNDNRYVKILEVEPINFNLRADIEKDSIINVFEGWLSVANIRLQFKSITKKADTERHIQMLKQEMNAESNEYTRELSRAYIKLIKDVGSKEALTRRFFIIMEYEPFNGTQRTDDFNEIYKVLVSSAITAQKMLARCGNKVVEPEDENEFLAEVLYLFYNRRSSVEEPFADRVNKIIIDTMAASGRTLGRDKIPTIPVANYIAPRGIDLSHINYLIMDGLYYTFIYIDPQHGYNDTVYAGWMSELVNAGEGIDVDLFLTREGRSKAIDRVSRKVRLNKIKMKDTYDTSTDYEDLSESIQSGYYIKQMLQNNNDLFYMNIIITITSRTYEGLIAAKREMKDFLKARDMIGRELAFRQEQALNSVTPLLQLDKTIFDKSKRNIMTHDAASTYMFTSFEMSDDNGILLGINQMNSSLCIIDLFNSKMYKNANMCILGTSGAGKTFTTQLMALRMRMRGIQVFILAPLKGHEFRRACNNIGGNFITINPGSQDCINIMEIRIPDRTSDILIEGEDAIKEGSLLVNKMQQLNIFFSLLLNDITNEEAQFLDEAIIDTYALKGITIDNDSLYIDEAHTKLREMPILGDLYNRLDNIPSAHRLATVLSRFVKGAAQSFNQQTNVDLTNKYIVMDISKLQDQLLPVGMFIALDCIWDKTKEDRTQKKAIFIDETWKLIGASSNKYAAEFVLEIFKIIRGYGGAAIAATQDLNDFMAKDDGKYGKGIINNAKTKIILNLEADEAENVKDSLKLSETEYMNILSFDKGEALIASNNNKVRVLVKPSVVEEKLITTDRAELDAQAKEAARQARIAEKKARDEQLAMQRMQDDY